MQLNMVPYFDRFFQDSRMFPTCWRTQSVCRPRSRTWHRLINGSVKTNWIFACEPISATVYTIFKHTTFAVTLRVRSLAIVMCLNMVGRNWTYLPGKDAYPPFGSRTSRMLPLHHTIFENTSSLSLGIKTMFVICLTSRLFRGKVAPRSALKYGITSHQQH